MSNDHTEILLRFAQTALVSRNDLSDAICGVVASAVLAQIGENELGGYQPAEMYSPLRSSACSMGEPSGSLSEQGAGHEGNPVEGMAAGSCQAPCIEHPRSPEELESERGREDPGVYVN